MEIESTVENIRKIERIRGQAEGRYLDLIARVRIDNSEEISKVVGKAARIVEKILRLTQEKGVDFFHSNPDHGIGHLVRGYAHSLTVLGRLKADPKELFVGSIGGMLHDIGCFFTERYEEQARAIRHAEAGALWLDEVGRPAGLSEEELVLSQYVVAAHTHYLKNLEVEDGRIDKYTIRPYIDMNGDGSPRWAVWFARWMDRLDCSGPAFVGRHFMSLADTHDDYSKDIGFYAIDFETCMRPLLRLPEEIRTQDGKATMLEHLNMFASSQTSSSPYGKYDYGKMAETRDAYKAMLENCIEAANSPISGKKEIGRIFRAWNLFLADNIEPTETGRETAACLVGKILALPSEFQEKWAAVFRETMRNYLDWSSRMLKALQGQDVSGLSDFIGRDIRGIIRPGTWRKLIVPA